ncbi:TVP38/TMEM64 family protein [Sutcliffiella cohnii]|uniref:TVP38/TMEM64 family protein n=1 Tax=Sutcliffiella cohnii TaxID=33932 RepID=UPI000AFC4401|nr:VTT domain-containing protein [Sutcliffiella cohnii]
MTIVNRKNIFRTLLLLATAYTIYILLQFEGFSLLLDGDIEGLRAMMEDNLLSTIFFTLLFMVIQNAVSVIPLILIVTINVLFFGFAYGYVWSFFTSVIGCIITFLVVRFWLQDFFMDKLNETIQKKIEENGTFFVFISRLVPVAPTSLINIASAVSTVSFKQYLIGTLFGNMIYIFFLSLIPLGLMSAEVEKFVLILIAIIAIPLFLYRKKLRFAKVKAKATNE